MFFTVTSSKRNEDKVDDNANDLPRVEVVRRLRDKLEPILLFGETESDACQRLKQIEIDSPESSSGITNDFQ